MEQSCQAEAVNQNESLAAETASWYKTVTDSMSEAMATSEVELDGNETNTRSKETNLADLILDAMVYEVQLHSADTVDAAIMNGAAITKSISAGDVSILDVLNVFPFEDNIVTFKVTGAEILEALEVTTYGLPEPTTSFPQVSGIVYSVDTSVPFEKGEQYSDTAYYRPANPGARITIDSIGGQPYDAEKLYTIASDDFVGSGGSGYLAFKDAYEANGYNLDIQVADAVMDYIKNKLNGVIGQEYAEVQGRITIY